MERTFSANSKKKLYGAVAKCDVSAVRYKLLTFFSILLVANNLCAAERKNGNTPSAASSFITHDGGNITIVYSVERSAHIRARLFTIEAAFVETLIDREQAAGEYVVTFSLAGRAHGVYLFLLTDGTDTQMVRVLYVD